MRSVECVGVSLKGQNNSLTSLLDGSPENAKTFKLLSIEGALKVAFCLVYTTTMLSIDVIKIFHPFAYH